MKKDLKKEFYKKYPPKTFIPVAYYNESLDWLIIKLEDCSVCEKDITDRISLLTKNHGKGKGKTVGLILKEASGFLK